ncbi:unnamed protein product [Didymodactylos carnosus]|uniref:Uncharacterized protein n=1 Tax=Didymodactylos carnosus TaxID=1234261 RepID=A0A814A685_9BILA|nr:unnamed protein product [Didymodactylos carnosus]CAF0909638.1 unnamed protein product [Didymodactylos carnosus]CAF3525505.1 unnamed protein product [Didymodactylos carnosus]CAF3690967.1 unnamed protein product [Didymodactylos carnosus]
MATANKDREAFKDLLQKRKHLNGYWVGKRSYSDEDLYDNDHENLYPTDLFDDDDHSAAKRASYLVGKRGTYLVGRDTSKRASYLVGRKRRDLSSNFLTFDPTLEEQRRR